MVKSKGRAIFTGSRRMIMKQLSGVLIALAVLLSGCGSKVPQEINFPTPVQIKVEVPVVLTFNQRVAKLNPSLQGYIKRLYSAYAKTTWDPAPWSKLDTYIRDVHKKAEKQYNFHHPISDKEVREIAYGIETYSAKWKIDEDWSVSYMTHESGFLDIVGDRINKKTKKPNPPSMLSLGQGQVQIDTATGNLKARGYDPTGLTIDDLLYFRLMNLDISTCVMASKIRQHGRRNGTKAYNAGDGGWRDGRSNQYYKDVLAVYKTRAKWHGVVK
jgi:hypothetical protein